MRIHNRLSKYATILLSVIASISILIQTACTKHIKYGSIGEDNAGRVLCLDESKHGYSVGAVIDTDKGKLVCTRDGWDKYKP